MGYRSDLEWMRHLKNYNTEEQKVLLALSHDKHKWRTKKRIMKVTGFDENELDSTISLLMERRVVRPSFSKSKNIIFGLTERVD